MTRFMEKCETAERKTNQKNKSEIMMEEEKEGRKLRPFVKFVPVDSD